VLTPRRFRVLAAVTAISGYLQIGLGGLVRVSGSGLGCPDWPTCHGKLYPPLTFHGIVEYTHRANGALLGLLVILVVVAGFWLGRDRAKDLRWLALATLLTVIGEGLLGWQVVANLLAPSLVMIHLAIALVILALMVGIYILSGPAPAAGPGASFGRLALGGAVLTFLLQLTGSAVVATDADLVCKSWPLCGGGFAFDLSGVAGFDVLHRVFAGVVGVYLLYLLALAIRRHGSTPGVAAIAWGTLTLLVVQVALGAGVAVTNEVAWIQAAHILVASAIWAGVAALAVIGLRPAAGPVPRIGENSRVATLERRPA
jgi:heme a synthase